MIRLKTLAACAAIAVMASSTPGWARPHHGHGWFGAHRGHHAMMGHHRFAHRRGHRGLHRGWMIGQGNPHRRCFHGVGFFGGGC